MAHSIAHQLPISLQARQSAYQAATAVLASDCHHPPGIPACLPHRARPCPAPSRQARLEVLDAESEGQLGFILELELANGLKQQAEVAALLTQVHHCACRGCGL